jgi:hypothetical protein
MAIALALTWLTGLWVALLAHPDLKSDAHGYWLAAQAGIDPYGRAWSLQADAYVYPPPFLQLIMPVARAVDWPTFHALWSAALMLGVVWIVGPVSAVVMLIPIRGWPIWESVIWGNIEIPMTVLLLLALRRPTAWAGLLLTKVTPGVAMLWHVARRQWRAIVVPTAVALAVTAVSFAVAPALWSEWIHALASSTYAQAFAAPLWLRVSVAAITVVLGGLSGRRWTIPVAVVVAHPAIWVNTLAIPILWGVHELRSIAPRSHRSPE